MSAGTLLQNSFFQDKTWIEQGKLISLRVKLVVAFTLIFSVIYGGLFYWYYDFARARAMSWVDESLTSLLVGTSDQIDGDQVQELRDSSLMPTESGYPSQDDPNAAYYWELAALLRDIEYKTNGAAFGYMFYSGSDENSIIFLSSGGAVKDPPFGVTFRYECHILKGPDDCNELHLNYAALKGQEAVIDPIIYTDAWGTWHSGYHPIRNSNGEVVAALGVDFTETFVNEVQRDVLRLAVPGFVVSYLLLFGLLYAATTYLTRDVIQVRSQEELEQLMGGSLRLGPREGDGANIITLKDSTAGQWVDDLSLKHGAFVRLWDILTKPHASVMGAERRQARLLAGFLLLITVLFLAAMLVGMVIKQPDGESIIDPRVLQLTLPLLLTFLATYLAARSDHHKVAAGVTAIAFYGAAVGLAIISPPDANFVALLSYLVVGVLVSSIFLPMRMSLIMGMVGLLTIVGLPAIDPDIPLEALPAALTFHLIATPLILMYALHHNRLEADRRRELVEINTELAQAVHEAQESNRLKTEFLATMSHELRTPLNSMIGYGQLLLLGMSGKLEEDIRYQISRIHANSKRLLGMINDILDISRIEAQRLEVSNELIDVDDLVREVRSTVRSLGDERPVTFEVEIDSQLPDEVLGDMELVRRIATNLLSNAYKFTHEGTIKLHLGVSDQPDEWFIRVKDTGIGIPPEARDYIFDRFRQVDGSSQRAYGGAGLGLAIVKQYTTVLKGHLDVSSEIGKGSMFTVYLPLLEVDPIVSELVSYAQQ